MTAAKVLNLRTASHDSWDWRAPSSDLSPADYSREMLRNARRYAKAPDSLSRSGSRYGSDGLILPRRERNYETSEWGYSLTLTALVGGGWGGYEQVTVATWAGKNRWQIERYARGNVEDALNALGLPEVDGRYLLIGAPARPERGVTKWRARWTIARKDVAGLTAIAGKGIDPRAVKARMVTARDQARATAERRAGEAAQLAERIAELDPLGVTLANMGYTATLNRLERFTGLRDGEQIDSGTVGRVRTARNRDRADMRFRGIKDACNDAQRQIVAAAGPGDGPTGEYGVRVTKADGTPNHYGPMKDAATVGGTLLAPDWRGNAGCGYGLHYIPFRNGRGQLRTGEECFDMARSFGNDQDMAVWIVKAGAERVDIDSHKSKAQSLTALSHAGTVCGPSNTTFVHRDYTRIVETLRKGENEIYERGNLDARLAHAQADAVTYSKRADDLTAALKEWHRSGK